MVGVPGNDGEGATAEGDPVTIDMQGMQSPIGQIASGMQGILDSFCLFHNIPKNILSTFIKRKIKIQSN